MSNNIKELIKKCQKGFKKLKVGQKYKDAALNHLETWLSEDQFNDYQPQIKYFIEQKDWDFILDAFYQIIPFGTGGRRGPVGIGPNRINDWTIRSSAQGHSQYLIKRFGDEAKKRGVVIAYDVREFFPDSHYNKDIKNPVANLTCKELAESAAQVYTANGIKVYLFDDYRSTPELSFAIRHLNTVAGDIISASHSPVDWNGKKVFDEEGGQLIPPYDEELVTTVTQEVDEIKSITLKTAKKKKIIEEVGDKVDQAYFKAVSRQSLSDANKVNIVYTPLHSTGMTNIKPILEKNGFEIKLDPKTSNFSGKFENVTFNIPNPEVQESFQTAIDFANNHEGTDIILSSDPDADRIGLMCRHEDNWEFINGQEISSVLAHFALKKKSKEYQDSDRKPVVIKTQVTTNLVTRICQEEDAKIIGDLLVGYKYIGEEMNKLEAKGQIGDFLFGCEESHGYVSGNYIREKDGALAALWLSELAAELKSKGQTIIDYLNKIYAQYGFCVNKLTEIRLPGAEGMDQIQTILKHLRKKQPMIFDKFKVAEIEDWRERLPIVSKTDYIAKNGLVFHFKPRRGASQLKITVRPSGTEPKVKMYTEVSTKPCQLDDLDRVKRRAERLANDFEQDFMDYCYGILGVDFPKRGYLLFWQLPLNQKLKYFEIEEDIAELKNVENEDKRQKELSKILSFLGRDAIDKVDPAFKEKYGNGIRQYLELENK